MHDFTDFRSDNFHEFCTQQHRSVSQFKLCKQNFENFCHKGSFFRKMQKILEIFQHMVLAGPI